MEALLGAVGAVMGAATMLSATHSAGFLTDDEFTAGLLIAKWAKQSREASSITKMEVKFARTSGDWPASKRLFWVKAWVGSFAWELLEAALIREMSVTEIEAHFDLPARSAKVALKTALSCAATCIHDDEAAIPPHTKETP